MYNDYGASPEVIACTFENNSAGVGGGAISNVHDVRATVAECRFDGNSAGKGNPDIDSDDTSIVKTSVFDRRGD